MMSSSRKGIDQFLGISVKRMFEKGIRFVYFYGFAVVHHLISTGLPLYITTTRSLMKRTTLRSWEMKI